jgi:hypothetical protein
MTLRAPRLPFGLDPLIAEAKRRARRRWALFLAAVVLVGGGTTGGGFLASLHHHSNSVATPGQPVAVLVARKLLMKGTTGDGIRQSGLYELRRIPRRLVETGAIVTPSALPDKVVQTDVPPGAQLTTADFSRPRYVTTPSLRVPTIRVLVATKPIPKGTPGDALRTTAGYYKAVSISEAQRVTGAILKAVSLSGKVTIKRVPAGQQLTLADFARVTR